jgi:hypothetical protein
VVSVIDSQDRVLYCKRPTNDRGLVLAALAPFRLCWPERGANDVQVQAEATDIAGMVAQSRVNSRNRA